MPLFSASRSRMDAVDDLLASAGLQHGRRQIAGTEYVPQTRHPRQEAPPPQQKSSVRTGVMQTLTSPLLDSMQRETGIRHGFSTRTGGVSHAYLAVEDYEGELAEGAGAERAGELNLGFTASDTREHVLANRSRFVANVFGEARPLVSLRQIHSCSIHCVTRGHAGEEAVLAGDGLMTDEPGIVLGIQTADCVPVLVADRRNGAVAAFHAGWRGTLGRIAEHGIGRMRLEFGSAPEDLVAAVGPAIAQCCYSIGEEVEQEFRSQFHYADELFCEVYDADPVRKKYPMLFMSQRAPGHSNLGPNLHLDLQEANRRQLLAAGLRANAIAVLGSCTGCRTDLFFSHRAEQGFTGRMLAVIGMD